MYKIIAPKDFESNLFIDGLRSTSELHDSGFLGISVEDISVVKTSDNQTLRGVYR